MSEKSTVYECVDREHDAWRCRAARSKRLVYPNDFCSYGERKKPR